MAPYALVARLPQGDPQTARALTTLAALADQDRALVKTAFIKCASTMETQVVGRASIAWDGQVGAFLLTVTEEA